MRRAFPVYLVASIYSLMLAAPAYASFSDVPSSHPNYDAINYVQAQGIVSGYPDGTYKPNNQINRAEFVKILIEAQYIGSNGPGPEECLQDTYVFPDVHRSIWYAPYACVAMSMGRVEGYPDGYFHGERSINFVEAAKILAIEYDFNLEPLEVRAWFAPYVVALEGQRAIPTSITRFDQPITRGEMAEMMYRLKAGITNRASQTYEDLATGDARAATKIKDVTADYPADLGPLVQNLDQNTEFPNDVLVFQALDKANRYPQGANELLQIFTRFYDSEANRYEEVCVSIVDLCDSMEQSDMLQQRSDLEADANMQIAGHPAIFEEHYEASSAYITRSYRFFTATNRIEINVGYDIGDLYEEEYNRRAANGESVSISELVAEDLGDNFANPYAQIRALYPTETVGMQQFFAQVDAMIGSMR